MATKDSGTFFRNDDANTASNQNVHFPGASDTQLELGNQDNDGKAVHKAVHYALRNELYQRTNPTNTQDKLDDTRHNNSGKYVFRIGDTVLFNQSGKNQGSCAGTGGNHSGTTADKCQKHRQTDAGKQAHVRMHTYNDHEADYFREQRKSGNGAAPQVADHVAEPLG